MNHEVFNIVHISIKHEVFNIVHISINHEVFNIVFYHQNEIIILKCLNLQIHQSYRSAEVSETVSLIYDGQNHVFCALKKTWGTPSNLSGILLRDTTEIYLLSTVYN